jgi:hypothetical protein
MITKTIIPISSILFLFYMINIELIGIKFKYYL